MKWHVANIAASCFYHLRHLRQIRCRVKTEVTTQHELAFTTSRLDYCKSMRTDLTQVTLERCSVCKTLLSVMLRPRGQNFGLGLDARGLGLGLGLARLWPRPYNFGLGLE